MLAEAVRIDGGVVALLLFVLLIALVGFVALCAVAVRAGRGSRIAQIVTAVAVVWFLAMSVAGNVVPLAPALIFVLFVGYGRWRGPKGTTVQTSTSAAEPAEEPGSSDA